MMLPLAPAAMAVTMEKVSDEDGFIVPKLHDTFPVPPTGGVVQTAPGGVESETNVVCAGMGASTITLAALLAPELSTA